MAAASTTDEERLALLKEVTGIEDDGVAFFLLDKNNGNVQLAVQEYLSGGVELPSTASSSSSSSSSSSILPSSTTNHVRRRSTSPGSERRIRARAALQQQQQHQRGESGELDDTLSALAGGGEGDEAPLLARGRSAGGATEGGANPPSSSLTALPGLLLRTLWAPVRYITGAGEAVPDPARAAQLFIETYEKEYHCRGGGDGRGEGAVGPPHPKFLPMSFQEATRLAARESKFLVVYLHAPLHEDTPAFVRHTLNAEPLVSFLDENMLVWGGSIHFADAYLASQQLDAAAFPFLALLTCTPPLNVSVLDHMEGVTANVEAVLGRLTAAMARHQDVVDRQVAAQRERAERLRLQEEQNREYQEALEADRRRDAALAAEKERQAAEESVARQRAAEAAAEEEARKEAQVKSLAEKKARLPVEPEVGDKTAIRLRLQFPHGRKCDRRFSVMDTIQVVRDYIDVQVAEEEEKAGGEKEEEKRKLVNYSLSTPYPKRTFEDGTLTLQAAGLHSADTIYITDLDA